MTTNPSAATIGTGGNATFTAAASGSPTPTVQWEVNTGSGFGAIANGGVYSGATTGTLTITGATTALNSYTYEAIFTNSAGSATTTAATLTVNSGSAYSVSADQTLLGPSNDTAASFTINGVSQGDTYAYNVTSSGGAGSVSGTGSVTSTGRKPGCNGQCFRPSRGHAHLQRASDPRRQRKRRGHGHDRVERNGAHRL